jgi:hypothetical protein
MTKKYPRTCMYFGDKHTNTLIELNKLTLILNCSKADVILHLLEYYESGCKDEQS